MNSTIHTSPRRRGFTLVEMIGVLAVIAVLAGLLVPRVFSAIGQSRINTAALGYNSLKSASLLYFGKYGRFGGAAGLATNAVAAWDSTVLLTEGFVEKPFDTQLASATAVNLVAASASVTVTATADGTYDLAGTTGNNTAIGTSVVEAVLTGVSADDAKELNDRIDGAALGAALGSSDIKGLVKFNIATGATGPVHLYIAHK